MTVEKDILFYILVPIYKVEKYVRDCIKSVLDQSYQNFRLILVDDGSPDNSGTICDEFARNDKRLHVIHQKNKGLIAARDTAIKYIQDSYCLKDSYVMFLDSDDSLKQNALSRIADVIRLEDCDMVIYGMDRVLNGQIVTPYDKGNTGSYMEEDKRTLYKKVFSDPVYNPVCRKAIRGELIPAGSYEKYYGISLAEDLLRSIDFYKAASTIYFLQESLYNYTINPESVTMTIGPDNYKMDFTIRERVNEYLEAENVFTESDWEEYRGFCVSLITGMVSTVGSFRIPTREKAEYYNRIAESDFYRKNLKGKTFKCGTKDKILFRIFESKTYWMLNLYGSIRKIYGNMLQRRIIRRNREKENRNA